MFGTEIPWFRSHIEWRVWSLLTLVWGFIVLSTPPMLLVFGFIEPPYSVMYFYPAVFCTFVLLWREVSGKAGVSTHTFVVSWALPYILLTLIGVAASLPLFAFVGFDGVYDFSWRILILAFLFSFSQEIIFREYAVLQMKRFGYSRIVTTLFVSLTFMLIHVFYPSEHLWLLLLITFGYSVVLSYVYYEFPNLWYATASHMVFNYLYAATGMFFVVT